jgi:hypothetical protein
MKYDNNDDDAVYWTFVWLESGTCEKRPSDMPENGRRGNDVLKTRRLSPGEELLSLSELERLYPY